MRGENTSKLSIREKMIVAMMDALCFCTLACSGVINSKIRRIEIIRWNIVVAISIPKASKQDYTIHSSPSVN